MISNGPASSNTVKDKNGEPKGTKLLPPEDAMRQVIEQLETEHIDTLHLFSQFQLKQGYHSEAFQSIEKILKAVIG